jgi:hypothetical protein
MSSRTRLPFRAPVLALAVASALAVGACSTSTSDQPTADGSSSPSPTVATSTSAAPPPVARPAPTPPAQACYALSYSQAVAPTTARRPVPCSKAHTAATYAVGRLDTVVDGHLLAVDSDRVQADVAQTCPQRFAAYVGGGLDEQRLSMLRPVWFTPTVQQSDAGAEWYRCDVVALAGDDRLATLSGPVRGVLDSTAGRDRYGMCGTAQPGSPSFHRVICSASHSWRAVRVVPFADGPYPGAGTVRAAGDTPCKDAGSAASGGALDYAWGYEWPSAQQWKDGQHFGRCWVPD